MAICSGPPNGRTAKRSKVNNANIWAMPLTRATTVNTEVVHVITGGGSYIGCHRLQRTGFCMRTNVGHTLIQKEMRHGLDLWRLFD